MGTTTTPLENQVSGQYFDGQLLESIFRTYKKTIQEYVRELQRHCRFKSINSQLGASYVVDDRGPLMDLYDACVQQDAHLRAVLRTVESQVVGERYILASLNPAGRYIKDQDATNKILGTQFAKLIKGIIEAKWYGYSLIELNPTINKRTGRLQEINLIERRNVLPSQKRVVLRQGQYAPNWDLTSAGYEDRYILFDSGDLGEFSATTPLILAKKFTLANYVNFSHTYGQPIIHGKTSSESNADRQKLSQQIASAAQNKVIVTGLEDEVDIKTFSMSNSEHIYTSLIATVNKEVSNLIVGSGSMAGDAQAYVGSANAHQDIFRERIDSYRSYVEDMMNEEVVPRLEAMGYIPKGLIFKYAARAEMANSDKIRLYSFLSERYEISPEEIEKEFGVSVGKQLNAEQINAQIEASKAAAASMAAGGGAAGNGGRNPHDSGMMSDNEYRLRYGHERGTTKRELERQSRNVKNAMGNFLTEGE